MDVFEKLKTDFKNIGGTVGTLTTSTLDNLKDKLSLKEFGPNDPHKIKSAQYPSFSQRPRSSKRVYQETEESIRQAEQHIAQMYPGYFDSEFDAVKHELSELPTETGHDDIDALVEKLSAHVEVVSGRLSGHVMKNHDQLIEGINTVASVEEDLQAAYSEVCSARAVLRVTSQEIQRNMLVAVQTRRKQAYMNLLEVCMKLKKAKDLQLSLKKAQEAGDYGEAMMLCVECFQGVESLKELSVSQEVKSTVNRLYVETTQKLDNTLQTICGDFEPQAYSKVLEGFMLQGLSGKQMAQKVLTCIKDSIHDNSTKVVRSLLLTKPKLAENLANSGLESSFGEMCRNLPVDLLRPCLFKLFEILFDVVTSYHIMTKWHEYGLQQAQLLHGFSADDELDPAQPPTDMTPQDQAIADAVTVDAADGEAAPIADNPQHLAKDEDATIRPRHNTAEDTKRQEELSQAEITTRSFLTSVHEMLTTSRSEVWDAVSWRIKELLNTIPFKGEDFMQVVDWCQKFLAAGEAFIGKESELRQAVLAMCEKFFESYHNSNLESLHMCLSTEHWKQIGNNGGCSTLLDAAVRNSPLYVPSYNSEGAVKDVEEWIIRGNPFQREDSKKKKTSKQLTSRMLKSRSLSSFGSRSELGAEDEETGTDSGLDSPVSTSSTSGRDGFQLDEENSRQSEEVSGAESSGRQEATGQTRMLTISSQQILKWIKSYGELIRPLHPRSEAIFQGITNLFDSYMLTTFIMFSGINLEDLVWKEDIVTLRLRSTLLRILTANNSQYKHQVEEIQRTRPTKPLLGDVVANPFTMNTASKFIDNLDQPFKSFANKLKDMKDNKLMDNMNTPGVPKPLQPCPSTEHLAPIPSRPSVHEATHGPPAVVASGNLYGLRERVVAVDSLMHIAEELKSARSSIQAALPSRLSREVDSYMSRTVEATQDLRDCIYQGGARLLLTQGMLDAERGITAQVAATSYAMKEPAISYSSWTEAVKKEYTTFRDLLNSANLPQEIAAQMWEQAIACGAQCILEGFARVRRCTIEGRSAMSLDLSCVEKALRSVVPTHVSINLRTVDQYIKAFYLPWQELSHWSQIHMQEYGKAKVVVLIECIAEAFKIKRQQKLELLSQIDAGLAEFA